MMAKAGLLTTPNISADIKVAATSLFSLLIGASLRLWFLIPMGIYALLVQHG